MHAVAEDRLAPGGVCVMTQQRSGGRWQSLDGGRGANDDAVIPRQAPRHEAAASGASHEDTLVKMLYEEHAGPLLMFVLRLTGGDRQRAEDIVQETLLRAGATRTGSVRRASSRCARGWSPSLAGSRSTITAAPAHGPRRRMIGSWRASPARRTTPTASCSR